MKFRTGYDGFGDDVSRETGLACSLPTRAKQAFKDECDINVIVKRFGIGYELPSSFRLPQFGDFSGIDSFEDAANAIAVAHENFDMLPADVRARFSNNPVDFVNFVTNADNFDDVVKMGLAKAKEAPTGDLEPPPSSPPASLAKTSSEPSGEA